MPPVEPSPSPWVFSDPEGVGADDLVAIGADLEPGTLLAAYRSGLFPMPTPEAFGLPEGEEPPMCWFSPVRRGVLPLDGLRVSRSLRQSRRRMEIRVDTAFDEVLAGCADPSRPGSWIDEDIRDGYRRLHELGWVHSVEAWREDRLVGGLYGVAVGGLFAGESMFHVERDASKVALLGLVELLTDEYADRRLVDVQWQTSHLASLGVVEWDRASYLARLPEVLRVPLPERWR